ncbi:MAG TPA: glycosyltransferase 87 family protein [Solirubrobacteraceae bacterium]|nr:glycosyltransferase 87 family protein [Solirubrobacteraceae bacterium]
MSARSAARRLVLAGGLILVGGLATLATASVAAAPSSALRAGLTTPGARPTLPGARVTLPAAPPTVPGARPTPSRAAGSTATDPNALTQPPHPDVAPPNHRLTANRVLAIADRQSAVRGARAGSPGSYGVAFLKGPIDWQVSYYSRSGREIAQVLIDDPTATVLEAWTGFRVAWSMARGYPGAFGRHVNALYIWLPLSLAFVLPFFNPRRPWRLLHLDLLALSAFSVSLAFFNHGNIETSVPLAYPPLVYLLVRMALATRRSERRREPIRLLIPASWLTVAVVFLIGFRVGLNLADSNVIDVGYAGVIGAHRLADGQQLYGAFPRDNEHGDTYGPVVYEAYVPFERALGWNGTWDDLPAAHAAAIAFDLLAVGLLFLLGRRIRGPTLGISLAYAWVTYPFTLFALSTNTNDVLVAVLILGALLASARPALRGALAALAGLSKFAPLALVPALALYRRGGQRAAWSVALFATGLVVATIAAFAPILPHNSLSTFYERTIAYQADRGSPFSVWGLYGGLQGLQTFVQVMAIGAALALAVRVRRGDVVGLAAACAASLIALQLGVTHWFYLYIVWFFPLTMLVLLGRGKQDLLDRVRAHGLRAADDHTHEPRVLV